MVTMIKKPYIKASSASRPVSLCTAKRLVPIPRGSNTEVSLRRRLPDALARPAISFCPEMLE